jgi:glutamyl-tRNA reductase
VIPACETRWMTTRIEDLEKQVERLVREHMEACHRAVAAAVARAFASSSRTKTKASRSPSGRTPSRATGARRTPEEIEALGKRLYEAVLAHPGETMKALAPHVGATPAELHRSMTRLKEAGRIRSVGQRHRTRYFPMAASAASGRGR